MKISSRSVRSMLGAASLCCVVVLLGACSSDSDSADSSTTTTAKSQSTDSAAGGSTSEASSEFLAAAEERGKPTLEATDPVTELVIVDDVVGTGEAVKPGDTVTVHYVGAAATTGEEFDSSWSRGEPISFGLDQVIAGWGTGLVGMKEGGRRTLVIPADQAYGNGGPAPGDSLVFTVDLISIDS
ncbi:FKBP-type peptidyl-prolyl cis-trans isomerase [Actinobacteria bacterium IMCC26207]|nr:FKBP-type peptidyl-prolyl cis-trans isomerase [Actinobacteria bacterium IMCC26207]